MSERIMSAGRECWPGKDLIPPPDRCASIQKPGGPLAGSSPGQRPFSSDKPAEQVLSLDCGHQIKTKAGRSQKFLQMVVCRGATEPTEAGAGSGQPRPHQLYLRDELITLTGRALRKDAVSRSSEAAPASGPWP